MSGPGVLLGYRSIITIITGMNKGADPNPTKLEVPSSSSFYYLQCKAKELYFAEYSTPAEDLIMIFHIYDPCHIYHQSASDCIIANDEFFVPKSVLESLGHPVEFVFDIIIILHAEMHNYAYLQCCIHSPRKNEQCMLDYC